MAQCWFVLLRFFLRVDGVLIRLRETRLFCCFTSTPADDAAGGARGGSGATVLRERSYRDETFEALRERGAPCGVAQYPDAETASQVLAAAGGPTSVRYDRLDLPGHS